MAMLGAASITGVPAFGLPKISSLVGPHLHAHLFCLSAVVHQREQRHALCGENFLAAVLPFHHRVLARDIDDSVSASAMCTSILLRKCSAEEASPADRNKIYRHRQAQPRPERKPVPLPAQPGGCAESLRRPASHQFQVTRALRKCSRERPPKSAPCQTTATARSLFAGPLRGAPGSVGETSPKRATTKPKPIRASPVRIHARKVRSAAR